MTVQPNLAFVIEDNADLANIYKRVLKSAGFEVETFLDGRKAYDRLATEPAPKLVLLDMHLPTVTGNEIAWEMWFSLENTSIIIITADEEMAAIYQNKEGVDNVLIKPVPTDVLADLVRPYLSPVR